MGLRLRSRDMAGSTGFIEDQVTKFSGACFVTAFIFKQAFKYEFYS